MDIVRKFSSNPSKSSDSKVLKNSMSDYHKILFAFVIKNLVPRPERHDEASYLDLTLMEIFGREMQIDFPGVMISYLIMVATDVKQNHSLPYGFLLTKVFAKLGVRLASLEYYSGYDALDYYENRGCHQEDGMRVLGVVVTAATSQVLIDNEKLVQENDKLCLENADLRAQLTRNEEIVSARHNDLMTLLRGLSPLTMPFSAVATPSSPSTPAT